MALRTGTVDLARPHTSLKARAVIVWLHMVEIREPDPLKLRSSMGPASSGCSNVTGTARPGPRPHMALAWAPQPYAAPHQNPKSFFWAEQRRTIPICEKTRRARATDPAPTPAKRVLSDQFVYSPTIFWIVPSAFISRIASSKRSMVSCGVAVSENMKWISSDWTTSSLGLISSRKFSCLAM